MLELLITYLQLTFKNAFPSTDVMGLAEKIQEGGKEFPAFYCAKDEYKPVSGSENYLYFRQNGNATEEESEEEAVSGCDKYITRTYPMVAVAYIPKNILNTDNAFIDSKIANNIANLLKVANYNSLAPTLQADEITAEIGAIDTNRYSVWNNEYNNVDFAARLDHVYLSVEFEIQVSATESCLRNYDCNDDLIVVDGNTITIIVQCEQMILLTEKENVTTFIEEDYLKGHVLSRIALWAAGTELTTTNGAISSYDPVAGRINFAYDLGGQTVKILIVD